jgi:uncharacterized protein YbjT (DUF2867 family)
VWTHKKSVTIEVVDEQGQKLAIGRFGTDSTGYRLMLRYVRDQWSDRRWAVEGANGVGPHPFVRRPDRAGGLPAGVQAVVGDVTRPESLTQAVQDVDAVVFTHGSNGSKADMAAVDYGGVRNVLTALGDQPARVALMTSIGITNRSGSYNRSTEGPDWKRRSERLVRASGRPYTIVRPGWFDYNAQDEQMPVFLQGDHRRSGGPSDGAVSRRQIAQVLVASLATDAANRKTFELVAEQGAAPSDLEPLFAALDHYEPKLARRGPGRGQHAPLERAGAGPG